MGRRTTGGELSEVGRYKGARGTTQESLNGTQPCKCPFCKNRGANRRAHEELWVHCVRKKKKKRGGNWGMGDRPKGGGKTSSSPIAQCSRSCSTKKNTPVKGREGRRGSSGCNSGGPARKPKENQKKTALRNCSPPHQKTSGRHGGARGKCKKETDSENRKSGK